MAKLGILLLVVDFYVQGGTLIQVRRVELQTLRIGLRSICIRVALFLPSILHYTLDIFTSITIRLYGKNDSSLLLSPTFSIFNSFTSSRGVLQSLIRVSHLSLNQTADFPTNDRSLRLKEASHHQPRRCIFRKLLYLAQSSHIRTHLL